MAAAVASARAQANGTTAGLLLEMPATARIQSLGAYAAVVGDEGSIFVNPAGMAPIRRVAIGASYDDDFLGARLTTGAVAARWGRFTVGVGAMYLDLGGDSVIVPDSTFGGDRGVGTGATISAYHLLGVGAVAYRRGLLSFGVSLKALRERIGDGSPSAYTLNAVTGDLSLTVALFDITAIGVAVQNVGGAVSSTGTVEGRLPRTTRVGWAINLVDPEGTQRVLMTSDWVAPPGGDSYWNFGVEAGAVSRGVGVFGRAGVVLGRAASERRPFSYGAGIQVRGLRLDYAVQTYRTAPAPTRRIGIRWIP